MVQRVGTSACFAYTVQHPTCGVFYFRRAVPADVRAKLGWEIKISLRTKNPREAKRRFPEAMAKADNMIERKK